MTPEQNDIRKRWIAALRSGEYKQGRERLCRTIDEEQHWCCLGVLSDLWLQEHPEAGEWEDLVVDRLYGARALRLNDPIDATQHSNIAGVPEEVRQWAGLYAEVGSINPDETSHEDTAALCAMNDRGDSFEQIADALEKTPEFWYESPQDEEEETS